MGVFSTSRGPVLTQFRELAPNEIQKSNHRATCGRFIPMKLFNLHTRPSFPTGIWLYLFFDWAGGSESSPRLASGGRGTFVCVQTPSFTRGWWIYGSYFLRSPSDSRLYGRVPPTLLLGSIASVFHYVALVRLLAALIRLQLLIQAIGYFDDFPTLYQLMWKSKPVALLPKIARLSVRR